ncbi:unnamed protein product [Thlaspi arvense]|uniref:Protein Iojap-related, mitochondrial n=1 Tax=Thlaspi arvense TaxID=13288 RepID=A0AAU9SLS0_THLAR|nr:unnamed protein product [Thlaspi arvense]
MFFLSRTSTSSPFTIRFWPFRNRAKLMLAALRSRCSSLVTSPPSPSLLNQSWKLGFPDSSRVFASSPSLSSAAGAYDPSEVLTIPEVEKILADVKADNVIVIPTQNQSCWADVTIIATGRSDWHLKNIAQALIYRAKQKQIGAKHVRLPSVQGYNSKWIVIDYGKFVVHALDEKARVYFNLESLWTTEAKASDNSEKELQTAFVKVRPINNSKKKPAAKVSS